MTTFVKRSARSNVSEPALRGLDSFVKVAATVAATNQGQTTPWKRFLATFTPEVQEEGERSAIAFVKQASEAYQALSKEEREALVDEEVDELEDDATGNDSLKQ